VITATTGLSSVTRRPQSSAARVSFGSARIGDAVATIPQDETHMEGIHA
jgi:hypothetical protein